MRNCNTCGILLIFGQNWYHNHAANYRYICIPCAKNLDAAKRRKKGIGPRIQRYGVPEFLPDGRYNPKYSEAKRRAKGIKPRQPSRYGVSRLLSNGKANPKYDELRRREKGILPRALWIGHGKYGVSSRLPNGKMNPEYTTAQRRARGIKPKKKAGDNKYGMPSHLPSGKINPEYQTARRRANGINPKPPSKYGVPSTLNGKKNLEWERRRGIAKNRARGMAPRPKNWGNTRGVPYRLPNGKLNPEYQKHGDKNLKYQYNSKYYNTPKGKTARAKAKAKRRFLYPLKTIWGTPLKGLVLHHMTKETGVYVPESINRISHCLKTGKNMDKINTAAMMFYESCDSTLIKH